MEWNDHLVIMELYAPSGQEKAFVAALERMAAALRSWKSMSYMPQPRGLEQFHDVGEVFLVREWQQSNQALLAAFPKATKICFGDAIGIYLAPTYMAPTRRLVRRIVERLMPTPSRAPSVAPDCYYLALAEAFDPVPSRDIRTTDTTLLRQVMDDLTPLVPISLLADLRTQLGRRRLLVLITSNFSEQGVMSPEAEIAAYMEYIRDQGFDRDSMVLLKPHPRDRREKAMSIESALRRMFANVFTLNDEVASYLPLEALVLAVRPPQENHFGLDLCTFSSACLGSKYILRVQPRIGFGAQMVKRYFGKAFIRPRISHELKLHKACSA